MDFPPGSTTLFSKLFLFTLCRWHKKKTKATNILVTYLQKPIAMCVKTLYKED